MAQALLVVVWERQPVVLQEQAVVLQELAAVAPLLHRRQPLSTRFSKVRASERRAGAQRLLPHPVLMSHPLR
ncbi:hypothetical protein HG717_37085 [Rhodococcus erythropolis]|uniref:hypothetical protein n=1 Tax=Rhodococcus erythropolis TaxID=1833 RepID=UPI001C9AEDE5|nr:hypothetical protein [Rhodococcus erythropolis]MBY6389482.1 hypothetical protein [Rhodococcus erythropolis]